MCGDVDVCVNDVCGCVMIGDDGDEVCGVV